MKGMKRANLSKCISSIRSVQNGSKLIKIDFLHIKKLCLPLLMYFIHQICPLLLIVSRIFKGYSLWEFQTHGSFIAQWHPSDLSKMDQSWLNRFLTNIKKNCLPLPLGLLNQQCRRNNLSCQKLQSHLFFPKEATRHLIQEMIK